MNLSEMLFFKPGSFGLINLMRKFRCCEKYYAGFFLGKEFLKFNSSNFLREEYSICCYHIKKYDEGLKTLNIIEESRHGDTSLMDRTIFNKKFFLQTIEQQLFENQKDLDQQPLSEIKCSSIPLVTFSITSCRRLDLFVKTMDCFLTNCLDKHLISQWICIDDNSSEEDRESMKQKYPFFDFIFKNINDKGHPESLQIITSIVKTPYLIHVEDDRALVDKKNYISDMIDILDNDECIGQVCFNHNYMETINDEIKGGVLKMTSNKVFYYEHEYCSTEEEKNNFFEKHGYCANCNYYPHFSLSPSMIKTKIFKNLSFQKERYFEYLFGMRYVEQGFKTAFLPGYHIKHTGRLTSEINAVNKLNAYDLLETEQFQEKTKYKCFFINLKRRSDRCEKIIDQQNKNLLPNMTKIIACDGKQLILNSRLRSFCRNNNFYMRPGVIGCALSHLKLYQQLLEDSSVDGYVIFEDDIISNELFINKMKRIFTIIENKTRPDIIFFTTILKPNPQWEEGVVKKDTREQINKFSIGGTGCYYISKNGAKTVIDYIEKHTLDEAIDSILFKQAPFINMYFVNPCIINQEYGGDTDIQNDFHTKSNLYEENISEDDYSKNIMYSDDNKLDLFDNLEFSNE